LSLLPNPIKHQTENSDRDKNSPLFPEMPRMTRSKAWLQHRLIGKTYQGSNRTYIVLAVKQQALLIIFTHTIMIRT